MLVGGLTRGFGEFWGVLGLGLINKGTMWMAVWELERIGRVLRFGEGMRRRCVLLFMYNPVAVFYHSIYSESIYTYLTFKLTSLTLQTPPSPSPTPSRTYLKSLTKATTLLLLSLLFRSTALFLLPVIGLPILIKFCEAVGKGRVGVAGLWVGVGGLVLGGALGVFGGYLAWAYGKICGGTRPLR